jgi:hypothetical protein
MISIDTVYQKVLALANKEQRGYITPQEYNLFANHAQMEIFEQYFYDINHFNRAPGNSTEYSDMLSVLQEKLSVLEARVAGINLTNTVSGVTVTGDQYQPVGTGSGPLIGKYFFFNKVAMNTFLGRSNYSGAVNTYFERTQKIKQYRLNTTVTGGIYNHKVQLPTLYRLGTVVNNANGKEIEQVNNNEWYLMKLSPLTTAYYFKACICE